jgi:hypothetical protein
MNNRHRHDQLRNEATHALVRMVPDCLVLEVEPFRGYDADGIYRNAGLRFPGKPARGPLDLLVLFGGRYAFLDSKTGKARFSKEQEEFCRVIRSKAGIASEFHSVEEAINLVMGGSR